MQFIFAWIDCSFILTYSTSQMSQMFCTVLVQKQLCNGMHLSHFFKDVWWSYPLVCLSEYQPIVDISQSPTFKNEPVQVTGNIWIAWRHKIIPRAISCFHQLAAVPLVPGDGVSVNEGVRYFWAYTITTVGAKGIWPLKR